MRTHVASGVAETGAGVTPQHDASAGTGTPAKRRAGPTPRRGDIQGLRAIAVLLVIGAHAGFAPLAGGFIGVDVFFVISGFLISRLLYLEASRTGTISLRKFYSRRARRILPAATVVSMATMVGALIWFSAQDALSVVYDVVWATFFAANVHFGRRGVDYFAEEQVTSPMQHYWSLAVEEQFYLLWPLLLLGCLAWVSRRGGPRTGHSRLPRIPVLAALMGLSVLSLGYGAILTRTEPVAAYFSTPARVWELGVGAILALVAPSVAHLMNGQVRGLVTATGLGLIAVSCIELGTVAAHPGSAVLLPVIGTAMVILAGSHGAPQAAPAHAKTGVVNGWLGVRPTSSDDDQVNSWLGIKPLRVIGDWSYSLYLWHWPVLVLAREGLGRELRLGETFLALIAIFGLSAATYWWVETPFRENRRMTIRRSLALYPATLAAVAVACVAAGSLASYLAGERGSNPAVELADYPEATRAPSTASSEPSQSIEKLDRAAALVKASVLAAREGRPIPSDLAPDLVDLDDDLPDLGDCNYQKEVRTLCPNGAADGKKTLVVMGDSHAQHWIPAFDVIGEKAGWKTYYLVRTGCTAVQVRPAPKAGESLSTTRDCADFQDWAMSVVKRTKPDMVAVSSTPPIHGVYAKGETITEGAALEAALSRGHDKLFTKLRKHAKRVVLMRDIPRRLDKPGTCLGKRGNDLGDCSSEPDSEYTRLADLSERSANDAGVDVIDPSAWVCYDDTCPPVVGSVISLRDTQHMSETYARTLARPLGKQLGLWPPRQPE
ncbi:MAG: acyltransferase family protein [Nocardioides sp.]